MKRLLGQLWEIFTIVMGLLFLALVLIPFEFYCFFRLLFN
jgi:hypothetical protein